MDKKTVKKIEFVDPTIQRNQRTPSIAHSMTEYVCFQKPRGVGAVEKHQICAFQSYHPIATVTIHQYWRAWWHGPHQGIHLVPFNSVNI